MCSNRVQLLSQQLQDLVWHEVSPLCQKHINARNKLWELLNLESSCVSTYKYKRLHNGCEYIFCIIFEKIGETAYFDPSGIKTWEPSASFKDTLKYLIKRYDKSAINQYVQLVKGRQGNQSISFQNKFSDYNNVSIQDIAGNIFWHLDNVSLTYKWKLMIVPRSNYTILHNITKSCYHIMNSNYTADAPSVCKQQIVTKIIGNKHDKYYKFKVTFLGGKRSYVDSWALWQTCQEITRMTSPIIAQLGPRLNGLNQNTYKGLNFDVNLELEVNV